MRHHTKVIALLCLLLSVSASEARLRRPVRSRRPVAATRQPAVEVPDRSVEHSPPQLIAQTLAPGPILSPAYVLLDVSSGRVLLEHNSHQHMFPASTTKTMTTLVAISEGDLEQMVTVGPNPPKVSESSINLLQGEQFKLKDLVRAALIKSANDSCVAIAEGVAGTVPKFVKLMNDKAKALGARDTHFVNPHGLHDPNHYTSAYDLALIAREAMKYPFFNEAISTREYAIHGNYKVGPRRWLINRNRLLFRWNECDGVKTGFTHPAGRCLIASATRRDRATGQPWRLLAVVMHAPDSWHDAANLLLHEGFECFNPVPVARAGEEIDTVEASGGAFRTHAVTARDVLVPLRSDEQAGFARSVYVEKLTAPLAKGQYVGYMLLNSGDRRLAKVSLVAEGNVPASLVTRVVPAAGRILPPDADDRLKVVGFGTLFVAFGLLLVLFRIRGADRGRARAY